MCKWVRVRTQVRTRYECVRGYEESPPSHQHAVAVGPGAAVDHLVLRGAALLLMLNAVLVLILAVRHSMGGKRERKTEERGQKCY